MECATISLPTPVSPVINTFTFLGAKTLIKARIFSIAADDPSRSVCFFELEVRVRTFSDNSFIRQIEILFSNENALVITRVFLRATLSAYLGKASMQPGSLLPKCLFNFRAFLANHI